MSHGNDDFDCVRRLSQIQNGRWKVVGKYKQMK